MKKFVAILVMLAAAAGMKAQTSGVIEAIAVQTGTTMDAVTAALKTGELMLLEVKVDDDGFIVVIEERSPEPQIELPHGVFYVYVKAEEFKSK